MADSIVFGRAFLPIDDGTSYCNDAFVEIHVFRASPCRAPVPAARAKNDGRLPHQSGQASRVRESDGAGKTNQEPWRRLYTATESATSAITIKSQKPTTRSGITRYVSCT